MPVNTAFFEILVLQLIAGQLLGTILLLTFHWYLRIPENMRHSCLDSVFFLGFSWVHICYHSVPTSVALVLLQGLVLLSPHFVIIGSCMFAFRTIIHRTICESLRSLKCQSSAEFPGTWRKGILFPSSLASVIIPTFVLASIWCLMSVNAQGSQWLLATNKDLASFLSCSHHRTPSVITLLRATSYLHGLQGSNIFCYPLVGNIRA